MSATLHETEDLDSPVIDSATASDANPQVSVELAAKRLADKLGVRLGV